MQALLIPMVFETTSSHQTVPLLLQPRAQFVQHAVQRGAVSWEQRGIKMMHSEQRGMSEPAEERELGTRHMMHLRTRRYMP